MEKMEEKNCPKCGAKLGVMLFMGVRPDFYACSKCLTAFDIETLTPLASIVAEMEAPPDNKQLIEAGVALIKNGLETNPSTEKLSDLLPEGNVLVAALKDQQLSDLLQGCSMIVVALKDRIPKGPLEVIAHELQSELHNRDDRELAAHSCPRCS